MKPLISFPAPIYPKRDTYLIGAGTVSEDQYKETNKK
jgi:hypothetical protein